MGLPILSRLCPHLPSSSFRRALRCLSLALSSAVFPRCQRAGGAARRECERGEKLDVPFDLSLALAVVIPRSDISPLLERRCARRPRFATVCWSPVTLPPGRSLRDARDGAHDHTSCHRAPTGERKPRGKLGRRLQIDYLTTLSMVTPSPLGQTICLTGCTDIVVAGTKTVPHASG
jgi:hypothetical protein